MATTSVIQYINKYKIDSWKKQISKEENRGIQESIMILVNILHIQTFQLVNNNNNNNNNKYNIL